MKMKTSIKSSIGFVHKFLRATALMSLMMAVANLSGTLNVFAVSQETKRFSGEQIFRGINFGDGPVAELFPEVWKNSQVLQQFGNERGVKALIILREKIILEIKTSDPTFMDKYSREMQSGEHLRIQAAMEESKRKITIAMQTTGVINESYMTDRADMDVVINTLTYWVTAVQLISFSWVLTPITIVIFPILQTEGNTSNFSRENYVNSVADRLAVAD